MNMMLNYSFYWDYDRYFPCFTCFIVCAIRRLLYVFKIFGNGVFLLRVDWFYYKKCKMFEFGPYTTEHVYDKKGDKKLS